MKVTNHFTLGILAHVDAGKTTLAEALLYLGGSIRRLGRVDHKDAYFDNDAMEKSRGITIFSKYAPLSLGEKQVTLLDTPGHVDFSAEMERALSVMDYAILVISGTEGVQTHTKTLFSLLEKYAIPVFLFVNKMDRPETDETRLMQALRAEFGDSCVDFSRKRREEVLEDAAMADEAAMEEFLSEGSLSDGTIGRLVRKRKLFPCFFGSALHMEGVREFLEALERYTVSPAWPEEFRARVFKIGRDDKGGRLTFLKLTGGRLSAREVIRDSRGNESKVSQIRLYAADRFETVREAEAGMICAVTGPEETFAGEGLGGEPEGRPMLMTPVMNYSVYTDPGANIHDIFQKMVQLSEEEPELAVAWNARSEEITVSLMGEMQTSVLQTQMKERFGCDVSFGPGNVIYKETILEPAEGIGHFEPLRHYAEVRLLLEPGEPGSGVVYENRCNADMPEPVWQKLIMTHLQEVHHIGVLTGSEITDMKISLIAGRSHKAHSQGADFREAAYRAVRQGLMSARCRLLEPMYRFVLEVPAEQTGRAMTDLQVRGCTFSAPDLEGESSVLTGRGPVSELGDYAAETAAYTGGRGRFSCTFDGYAPCHREEEVIRETGYDPEADLAHPSSSLFVSHGAAVYVGWQDVEEWAHTEGAQNGGQEEDLPEEQPAKAAVRSSGTGGSVSAFSAEDRELEEIFNRTFGKKKDKPDRPAVMPRTIGESTGKKPKKQGDTYLLVDGYNIIFAWEELADMARKNIDSAREMLMDILSNYQGYRRPRLILVFDAYKVTGGVGSVTRYHNIDVVYTREAETADAYIERVTREIAKHNDVTVATSDGLEQIIIWGHGARRMSAAELKADIAEANIEIAEFIRNQQSDKVLLFDSLNAKDQDFLEEIRLGRRKWNEEK